MQPQTRDELMEYRFKLYRTVIPVFITICLIALLLNFIVIWALKRTKIYNTGVVLILSLTLSDMWTSFMVVSSLVYNSYLPIVQSTTVNPCVSLTLENLRTAGLLTGTCHLLLIAFNQYTGIVRPHLNKEILRQIAIALCIVAWVCPILTLILLSFSVSDQGYFNCSRVDFYTNLSFRAVISGILIVVFVCIVILYVTILFILKKQTSKLRSRFSHRRVLRVLWTGIFICSAYFAGWAPAIVVFLSTCSTCELLRQQKFRTIFLISCVQLAFILAKSLLNPIIYSIRIPDVDYQIRKLLNRFGRKINQIFITKSNSNSKDGSTGINQLAPEDRLLEDDNTAALDMAPLNVKKNRFITKSTIVRI